jgi:GT2 family glycosyltransferase
MTVTIAICTNGRDSLIHAVESISKQSIPPDKLLIIDQSGKGAARTAVEKSGYQGACEVVDQDAKGLSKARNEAVDRLDSDWLFFTDDDCILSLDLVEQLHKVVARYPEAAFLAGSCIRPLDYNPVTHDVPGLLIHNQIELNADTLMKDEDLIGACLAFRRDLLVKVGKFDDYLGAGTEWPAGEECDYAFRAILAGYVGRATARLLVFHEYGARVRPKDDIDNGRIGNAVVYWKMKQIGDPRGIEMARRIRPYGPKKVIFGKLTMGKAFDVDLRMRKRCVELYERLQSEFSVHDGVIVKKSP